MVIKILHQYHNNMFDTYTALSKSANIEFLSHRTSKLTPEVRNRAPKTFGRPAKIYDPLSLWKLLKESDIVILKHINNPLNLLPLLFSPLLHVRPVIVVQRLSHRTFPGYRILFAAILWWTNRIGGHVVAVTRKSFHELQHKIAHITYLPASINIQRFEPAAFENRKELRVITVGKFQKRKHIPLLLGALEDIRNMQPSIPWRLTIIANHTSEPASRKEKDNIASYIKSNDLEAHVDVIEDAIYSDMPQHYKKSHLFILPATNEPLGYAVVEAMASGLPIIVGSKTGAASYIEDGKNGYIFDSGSRISLREKIKEFTQSGSINWQKLIAMGKKGYSKASTEHSPSHWVELLTNQS